MFENLPGRAQDILATSENMVRSLTCKNLEFSTLELVPSTPPSLVPLVPPPLRTWLSQIQEENWAPKATLQAHNLVAWQDDFDGFGLLLPPTLCCVLAMDATLSSHTSLALDDILVDSSPRMGAKLSLASLSHRSTPRSWPSSWYIN
ncbi:hypothetical protein DSO57_1038344 [Entomophthora muscae]|uniref:Uncharacterized protein n=1 Tax=Entomophthora muscae TaxID=34485 RepID=A0ACC2TKS9_9FUNG|nr:hypothetical protein DSO57_1038344 [Entomophthora muscae]